MAITKKRKKFFNVEMPIINHQTQLQAFDIKELDGRYIQYDLTRILKGKNILLQLKVKVNEKEATAIPWGIKLMPSYLRRMVRKGTDYVEESFSANCKDAQLKIKPLLVTRRKVSKAVKNALREKVKEEIIKNIKSEEKIKIFDEILKNKFQRELSLKLKKIYPLSLCVIRILKVEKEIESKKEVKEKK